MRKIAQAVTGEKTTLSIRRRLSLVFAALLGALVLLGGTAYAAAIQLTGSETTKQYFVSENAPFTVATVGSWQNVPTAVMSINVPSGTSRMIDARYTAESLCTGTGGWCSVRIALFSATGVFINELHPGAGTDYKFDTPGGAEEIGALERTSGFVGAGTYTVRVQALRTAGVSQFTLDDSQFVVGLVNP